MTEITVPIAPVTTMFLFFSVLAIFMPKGMGLVIVALLLTLLSAHFAYQQLKDARRSDEAVVMRSVTTVQSAPASDASKTLFILHEGTKVRLLDRVSGYSQIELSDGRQGWIKSGDIEVI